MPLSQPGDSAQSGFVEPGLSELSLERLHPRREIALDDALHLRLSVSLHCAGFIRALFVAMDPVPVVAPSQRFREQGRLPSIGHGTASGSR